MEFLRYVVQYLEQNYIAKIYSIVGAQLFATGIIKFLSEAKPQVFGRIFCHYLITMLLGLTFFSLLLRFRDVPPWNFIFFAMVNLILSISIAPGTYRYTPKSVVLSALLTSIWFATLSCYGVYTIQNYSIIDKLVLDYWLAHYLFFTISLFQGRNFVILSAFLGEFVTSVMAIPDSQKLKQRADDKDYGFLFVAIDLYLIFMILFSNCLTAFGKKRSGARNFCKTSSEKSTQTMAKLEMAFGVGLLLLTISIIPISGWRLVWRDEFNGNQLNESTWEYQIGDGCSYICGWGNNEQQWYRKENTQVKNGRLIIQARREDFSGKRYTSSRLRTMHKGDWKYGKILVRAKMPKGQGVWPAIWMLPTDNRYGGWPRSGTIDIVEVRGQTTNEMEMTAHFGNAWNEKSQLGTTFTLPSGSFSDDFHTFGIEWGPNYIKWLVDDSVKYTLKKTDTSPYTYPFNERFHLLLNVAVGGGYVGNPGPDNIFPTSMEVDWVRVYQNQI